MRFSGVMLALSMALGGCGDIGEDAIETSSHRERVMVCPEGETVDGIDVSHHQDRIDWDQVSRDGIEYAFIRVSDGLFEDEEFERNWPEARRVGVIRGVYQYFRSSQDVAAQVDLLLRKMGPLLPGDLPPVLDIETIDGASDDEVRAAVEEWTSLISDATGRTPIVYTYPYFIYDHVRLPELGQYPLWIAHYGPRCPEVPPPWEDWLFHQTSSSGMVAGIEGRVDTDLFNGSLESLLAFADFTDECGDGICTGTETPADCPGDCPVCHPIPAEGRVVDESEICFAALGPTQYWRSVDGAGWDDHLLWTHTTGSDNAANYAVWNVEMEAAGRFRVDAFTDARWAESVQAAYDVEINGVVQRRVVDQTEHDGWMPIVTVAVEAGDSVEVRLDDNTGEPNSDEVRLVADAIRFVPTDQDPDPFPEEEEELDAGVEPDAGRVVIRIPERDQGMRDAVAPQADDGERQESLDGCDAAGGGSHEGALSTLFLIGLGLVGRRRRRAIAKEARQEA